jgi:hypothetical protein
MISLISLKVRSIEIFTFLCVVALCLCFAELAHGSDGTLPQVIGTVSVLQDRPILLRGVDVKFESPDAEPIEVRTDEKGEFKAEIEAGKKYAITVSNQSLCTIHRPPFVLQLGETVRFAFEMVFCVSDPITIGPPGTKPEPYSIHYAEERLPLGKSLPNYGIVAFGSVDRGAGTRTYNSLPIFRHAPARMPVTIAFDRMTITADAATLDDNTQVLTAKGSVLVTDGSERPPRRLPCASVDFSASEWHVVPCKP